MADWDSLNDAPPSLLYPPEGKKWFARSGLPGTRIVTAPNGRDVCIVELRGWLRKVDGQCNAVDPDWHYTIELDPEWIDALGIGLEVLLQPGDVIRDPSVGGSSLPQEIKHRSSDRARYLEPMIHIELDGWPRADTFRGSPPKPASWTKTNECNAGATFWPFDPQNPKESDPGLAPGQYVRVVGSLVTDQPHMSQAKAVTSHVFRFGYGSAVAFYGQPLADLGESNAIKQMWGGNLGELDPSHPARWNEIHSPDYIGVLADKPQTETVRCIAIVAQNGLFQGDTEEITAEIAVPLNTRPSRWHGVSYRELVGPTTRVGSVLHQQVTQLSTGIRVHVKVEGQAGLGASGKFFGVYRVGWGGIRPRLRAASSSDGTTMSTAVDGDGKTMVRPGSAASPFWTSAWFQVQSGAAKPASTISVVSRAPGYFDAFVVAPNAIVHTAATQGGAWGGWWMIPGLTAVSGGPISAISRSLNKLDIFLADDEGRIMSAAWEPGFPNWAGWWHINGGMTVAGGEVTGVSRSSDHLDIFTVGTDAQVWTASWAPGNGWQGWWAVSGLHTYPGWPVTCVSRAPDSLDVFVTDLQGRVMWNRWEQGLVSNRQAWTQVLNGVTRRGDAIAAVSRRTGFLDIFVVGTDGQVWTAACGPGPRLAPGLDPGDPQEPPNSDWQGWWPIAGVRCLPGTPVAALSPKKDVLLVMASALDGNLVGASWSPNSGGWSSWSQIS